MENEQKDKKSRTYENGLVIMMFFTLGFVFMDRLSILFLLPTIGKDWHLNNAQLGLIVSTLAICFAFSGWILSSIGDLKGMRKKILVPITAIFSLCSIFTGLAKSFVGILWARAVMGIAEGPVMPLGMSMLSAESTPKRRGFNLGFSQSGIGLIGATLTPVIVTSIAASASWHVAFYVVAIPGLIMTLVLWKFLKEPFTKNGAGSPVQPEKLPFSQYIKAFRHRNVILAFIMFTLFMGYLFVFTTFAPVYLVDGDHFQQEQMGMIMTAIGFGSFIWGFLIPTLSDKWGRKPTIILFSILSCLCPVALAVIHGSLSAMLLIGFLTSMGQGCIPLMGIIMISESVPAKLVASVGALLQLVGEIIGGAVFPYVAGIAADGYGLTAPLWIAAAGSLVAALLGFAMIETAPVKKVQAPIVKPLSYSNEANS